MGMGIGDWAQSPIPNPQSPILITKNSNILIFNIEILIDIFFLYI